MTNVGCRDQRVAGERRKGEKGIEGLIVATTHVRSECSSGLTIRPRTGKHLDLDFTSGDEGKTCATYYDYECWMRVPISSPSYSLTGRLSERDDKNLGTRKVLRGGVVYFTARQDGH